MLGAAPANLAELLKARQSAEGAYVSVTATGTRRLAYNQLYERAGAMATWLAQETGDPPQGREAHAIVLTLADPLEFVTAFFAVALIGAVPVPGPTRVDARPGHKARLVNIVKASRPAFVIADDDRTGALREALDQCDVTILPIGQAATSQGIDPAAFRVHPSCYEQYTSGSVSVPKPIVISQKNVLAQLRQAAEAFGETHDSVSVNWVPLYHDMGLVTSVLRPLWSDYTSVLLDAFHFVREPHIWPAALTDWRATHTSAPDFGYALCARKVTDVSSYDLSPLRVARNAGEPVRPATLHAFTDRFASAGFRFSAFKPSYGLAEATLTVTACRPEDPPKIIEFSATSLRSGRAAPAHDGDQATALVSCGPRSEIRRSPSATNPVPFSTATGRSGRSTSLALRSPRTGLPSPAPRSTRGSGLVTWAFAGGVSWCCWDAAGTGSRFGDRTSIPLRSRMRWWRRTTGCGQGERPSSRCRVRRMSLPRRWSSRRSPESTRLSARKRPLRSPEASPEPSAETSGSRSVRWQCFRPGHCR